MYLGVLSLCLCLSSEVCLRVAGAEQLHQVKRMQRTRARVVSTYSQSLIGKIQWLLGASDNSASATSRFGDEGWTQNWVKVSPP